MTKSESVELVSACSNAESFRNELIDAQRFLDQRLNACASDFEVIDGAVGELGTKIDRLERENQTLKIGKIKKVL
jgi:hypothetical protein